MFPFDAAALPQLTTRKALIAVDFQTDFVGDAAAAALPVSEPDGFVARALALSEAFRDGVGDVVWVKSVFSQVRPADQEHIITSDEAASKAAGNSRRAARAKAPGPLPPAREQGPPDPEAFLSHHEPACVRPSSPGAYMAPAVKSAVRDGDTVLTKSHYSPFLGTPLLRLLRANMVMELFICGSLANVGVYATALDVAGHGMAITVVEDCCGYRAEPRQIKAVRSLIELAGCEIASYQEVLDAIQSEKKKTKRKKAQVEATKGEQSRSEDGGDQPRPVQETSGSRDAARATARERAADSPDIVKPMTGLRLVSDSPCPAPALKIPGTAAQARASDIPSKHPRPVEVATIAQRPNANRGERHRDDGDSDEDSGPEHNSAAVVAASSATLRRKQAEAFETAPSQSGNDASGRQLTRGGVLKTSAVAAAESGLALSAAYTDTDDADDDKNDDEDDNENDNDKDKDSDSNSDDVEDDEDNEADNGQSQAQTVTGLCEGDTAVIANLLPRAVEADMFGRLRAEVQWQRMSHQGGEVPRLVAVQGAVSPDDGSAPVYRHPSDEAPPLLPFSPAVLVAREAVEEELGHPVNHVLIQFYRHGGDYISEHSDKTLDIARGSYIANVSLGAQRTMAFRTKRPARMPASAPSPRASGEEQGISASPPPSAPALRRVHRAALPHNSLCKMGPLTNMKWLHAIRPDRRADRDKSPAELAYGGARISLTFRRIATFLDRHQAVIWGQGATAKTRGGARPVVNGQGPEAVAMLRAFGAENHASDFDWDAHYGGGFDVLHMRSAPRFFSSAADPVANMGVALMLAEYGIGYARGSVGPAAQDATAVADGAEQREPAAVKFVDDDAARTTVQGDVAIMLYLEARHGQARAEAAAAAAADGPDGTRAELAARFTRFQRALGLRNLLRPRPSGLSGPARRELAAWDAWAADARGGRFIAGGPAMSLADFALWPALHALAAHLGPAAAFDGLPRLRRYYDAVAARESAVRVLRATPAAAAAAGWGGP